MGTEFNLTVKDLVVPKSVFAGPDFRVTEIPAIRVAENNLRLFGSAVEQAPAVRAFLGVRDVMQSRALEAQRALQRIEATIDRSSLIRNLRAMETNLKPFVDSILSVQRNWELEARRLNSLLGAFRNFKEEAARLRETLCAAMAPVRVPKTPEFHSGITSFDASFGLDSLIPEPSGVSERTDLIDPTASLVHGGVGDYSGLLHVSDEDNLVCPACQFAFSVDDTAFFCPRCGVGFNDQFLDRVMQDMRANLDDVPRLRSSVLRLHRPERLASAVIENTVTRTVAWFQVRVERMYRRLSDREGLGGNSFQNLDKGSRLWRKVTGREYSDYLDAAELQRVQRFFQIRHLLEHRLGRVDETYMARCVETKWTIGQRVVPTVAEVRDFLETIVRLVEAMAADAPPESWSESP